MIYLNQGLKRYKIYYHFLYSRLTENRIKSCRLNLHVVCFGLKRNCLIQVVVAVKLYIILEKHVKSAAAAVHKSQRRNVTLIIL